MKFTLIGVPARSHEILAKRKIHANWGFEVRGSHTRLKQLTAIAVWRVKDQSKFPSQFLFIFHNFSRSFKKYQILLIFIANFAEIPLNFFCDFVGISYSIQKMLQNAENLKKTATKLEEKK